LVECLHRTRLASRALDDHVHEPGRMLLRCMQEPRRDPRPLRSDLTCPEAVLLACAGRERNADRQHRYESRDDPAAALAPECVRTRLSATVARAPERARPRFSSLAAIRPHLLVLLYPRHRARRMSCPSPATRYERWKTWQ